MNVLLGWAVLDCGAVKSLAGAELAAMLAQAFEKSGRKAEAVQEKYMFVDSENSWSRHSSSCKSLELAEDKMCSMHQTSLMAARHIVWK